LAIGPTCISLTHLFLEDGSGAVFRSNCLLPAIGCFVMGLYAIPIALARDGIDRFFTGVVLGMEIILGQASGRCVFIRYSLFSSVSFRFEMGLTYPFSINSGFLLF